MAGGYLGHRSLDDAPTPRRVAALAGVRIVAAAAGTRHSLVLAADGTVYSFGDGGADARTAYASDEHVIAAHAWVDTRGAGEVSEINKSCHLEERRASALRERLDFKTSSPSHSR